MHHLKFLQEIVAKDFKGQFRFFANKMVLSTELAPNLYKSDQLKTAPQLLCLRKNQRLFQTFKLKTNNLNSKDNFFSNESFKKLCFNSQNSLRDLTLRNASQINQNVLLEGIQCFQQLQKLDLSYNADTVTDVFIKDLFDGPNKLKLTSFSARCCSKLTSTSFAKLILNLGETLESLDVSGCVLMQNDALCSLRHNKTLKVLLLEHLRVSNQGLSFLQETSL